MKIALRSVGSAKTLLQLCAVPALLGGAWACSGNDAPVPGAGSGGAASGAGAIVSGGNTTSAKGGASMVGAGGSPVGGNLGQGGSSQALGGSKASGGASQGGVGAGGAATSLGGKASGGVQSGGTAPGVGGTGMAGTAMNYGGATSGGSSNGNGGKATGGGAVGGAASGGKSSSGGNTGSGGTTGGTATGPCVASPGTTGRFELLFEDPFNSIDSSRWGLMTHSWDGNLAQFTAANASTSGGILTLALTSAPGDTVKPFRGVEMRSVATLTYGRVEGAIRFAAGSGAISALVTIYTPWPPDDWNELDVEFLGKGTSQIQFNHMVNIPPAEPIAGHLQFPKVVTLPFSATAGFHTYVIEWVPGRARFIVDGTILHETTQEMSRMTRPQNVLLTIWASNSVAWAGPIDSTTPTSMQVDWIRLCRYVN